VHILDSINHRIDRWLTAPVENAAGRMSLYRIVYVLFYLWVIHDRYHDELGLLPDDVWVPVRTMTWLTTRPSPEFFRIIEVGLVIGLFLLLIGYRVRTATIVVFAAGLTLGAFRMSFGKISHSDLFLTIYIPAIMIFSRWGSNYSLDAYLRRRRGEPSVSPNEASWRYAWPMHATIILLGVLFFSSGYLKLIKGQWLSDSQLISNLLLSHNVRAEQMNRFPNVLNPIIAATPLIYVPLRFIPLTFELFYPLAWINRRWRTLFVSTSLVFHAFNVFFLNVVFTPMIITYILFVDWQALYQRSRRYRPHNLFNLERVSSQVLVAASLLLVAVGAFLWYQDIFVRNLFGTYGLINGRLVWFVVAPLALLVQLKTIWQLLGDFSNTLRNQRRNKQRDLTLESNVT